MKIPNADKEMHASRPCLAAILPLRVGLLSKWSNQRAYTLHFLLLLRPTHLGKAKKSPGIAGLLQLNPVDTGRN